MGAKRVIGLDVEDYRRQTAERTAKSETINAKDDDCIEQIRAMTEGRGADVVIDAVGMEARGNIIDKVNSVLHAETGNINCLKQCFSAVRRAGVVSVLGVYATPYHNFPLGQIFDKGIQLKGGQAPAHKYVDRLLEWVLSGKITPNDIISHRLPLSEAAHAYQIFNDKKDDCVKVVLTPGS
ncbi:hypothetical protein BH09BAC1_BH09BAC1_29500 [soil metagenome]